LPEGKVSDRVHRRQRQDQNLEDRRHPFVEIGLKLQLIKLVKRDSPRVLGGGGLGEFKDMASKI
jgi:hypothetical protein